MATKFTASDWKEMCNVYHALNNPDEEHCEDCADGSCDCHLSETVMTSRGYVEVYRDGEVIQNGIVVENVGQQ